LTSEIFTLDDPEKSQMGECFNPDRRRTSPKRESRTAFLDRDFFTMSYAPDLHSRKTVNCSILRPESGELPRPASTGEGPPEKKGATI